MLEREIDVIPPVLFMSTPRETGASTRNDTEVSSSRFAKKIREQTDEIKY